MKVEIPDEAIRSALVAPLDRALRDCASALFSNDPYARTPNAGRAVREAIVESVHRVLADESFRASLDAAIRDAIVAGAREAGAAIGRKAARKATEQQCLSIATPAKEEP